MTSPCPICHDYLIQLRRASARGDDDNYQAVKALYLEHLKAKHNHPAPHMPVSKMALREAMGKMGE